MAARIRIIIEAIPHREQRVCVHRSGGEGDWFYDESGNLNIRISGKDILDPETFLYGLHELVEAMLCRQAGISQEAVDDFDDNEYFAENGIEPGDAALSPYRSQHRFAMLIEHLMAHELGIHNYGQVT